MRRGRRRRRRGRRRREEKGDEERMRRITLMDCYCYCISRKMNNVFNTCLLCFNVSMSYLGISIGTLHCKALNKTASRGNTCCLMHQGDEC